MGRVKHRGAAEWSDRASDEGAVDRSATKLGLIRLRLDGISYELELTGAEARRLRAELRPWISRARPASFTSSTVAERVATAASPQPGLRRRNATRIDRLQLAKIRQWALQNGHLISPHGRVPAVVQQAFAEAHA